jgi:uncharacterized lipoprotein YddW (UPF0748 family)
MSYNAEVDYNGVFRRLQDVGIDGILLAASIEQYKEVLPLAEGFDFEIHAWKWILNRPKKTLIENFPSWYMVNKKGTSMVNDTMNVPHYKFLCPAIPEVQSFILSEIDEVLALPGIDGICMDYLRFPDVILPEKLQEKYGFIQNREYSFWDYGYHPAMIAKFKEEHDYDPSQNADPSQDLKWKQFRYDQITELANKIADKAHKANKLVSATPYASPQLAIKHVRQEFTKWNLDYVFPMSFSGFYEADGPNWIASNTKETLASFEKQKTKVIPGLFAPSHKKGNLSLPQAMHVVEDAGADGVAIFSYNSFDDLTTAMVKDYIETNPFGKEE